MQIKSNLSQRQQDFKAKERVNVNNKTAFKGIEVVLNKKHINDKFCIGAVNQTLLNFVSFQNKIVVGKTENGIGIILNNVKKEKNFISFFNSSSKTKLTEYFYIRPVRKLIQKIDNIIEVEKVKFIDDKDIKLPKLINWENSTEAQSIILKVKKIRPNAKLPEYKTEGAAGMDLAAAIKKTIIMNSGEIIKIPTGLIIEFPLGYEAQIRSRSGLSLKGITVANSPGTFDQDSTGEVFVILKNDSKVDFMVNAGDRIAQMVIAEAKQVQIETLETVRKTKRGNKGFGHTGIK